MRLFRMRPVRAVPDVAVFLLAAACLAGAWLYHERIRRPAHPVTGLGESVHLEVPAGWSAEEVDGALHVSAPALGRLARGLRIERLPEDAEGPAMDLLRVRLASERAEAGAGHRVLSAEEKVAFGGHESEWTHYALVREPPGAGPEDAVMPLVVRGVDILVTPPNGPPFRIEAEGPATEGDLLHPELSDILSRVELRASERVEEPTHEEEAP